MAGKVYACFCVYNEKGMIGKAMEAVAPHVHGIIIVDGRYENFPGPGDGQSTDGTLDEVIKTKERLQKLYPDLGFVIIETRSPWKNEMTKRNAYIGAVNVGDWVFDIDADEWVEFAWALRNIDLTAKEYGCNAFHVLFRNEKAGDYSIRPRLHRKKFNLRLQNDESDWRHDEADPYVYRMFPLVARNVDHLRPRKRQEQRAAFYKKSHDSGMVVR